LTCVSSGSSFDPTPAPDVVRKADVRDGGRVFGVAWLGYTAAAALMLWRAWTPAALDRLVIGGPEGDFLRQFLPYRAFVARTLASGRLPLWNPHQDAGTPALADPQLAVLYPWRLLQAPLALGGRPLSVLALVGEAVAHVGLAGALTFGLLRALGARPAAAALGGLAYALSGYLSGYPLDQLAVLDSAAWLPGILWGLVAATRAAEPHGRRRAALLAAVATALALLAGHPQTVSFALAAGMAWLMAEALRGRRAAAREARVAQVSQEDADPEAGRSTESGVAAASMARTARMRHAVVRAAIPRSSLGLALWWLLPAAGLAAAQWLPSWRFLAAASRELSRAELLAGLPPRDLLQLVAPHALSRWSPLYVGLPTLVLAAWGAWRAPASRFWLALAGGGALWSLGGNAPLAPMVLRLAPALMPFRHQERAAVLVALGLAVAAGLAAERLARGRAAGTPDATRAKGGGPAASPPSNRRRAWLEAAWFSAGLAIAMALLGAISLRAGIQPVPAGAGPWSWADATIHAALYAGATAMVLALAAAGRLSRSPERDPARTPEDRTWRSHRALPLLSLVLAIDLLSVNTGHALGPVPDGGIFPLEAGVQALVDRARDGRVSSEGRLPGGANAATIHGFFDATGDSPLHLAPVQRSIDELPELVWWRLLGVRYLVSDREVGAAEAALLQPLSAVEGGVPVYELALPAPPVWTTPRTACHFQSEPWEPGPDFDPLREVVVTTVDAERAVAPLRTTLPTPASIAAQNTLEIGWPFPHSCTTPEGEPVGAARLVGLDPGRAAVEAELPAGAWVVWSNAWDPGGGWRAVATAATGETLRPPVVSAYGSLTAVWLPAGVWRIEWTYRPLSVILGGLISLLSGGLCLAAFRMGRSR
jgi:hypothetical protein